MMYNRLFRKHYLLFAVVIILFVFIGFGMNTLIMRMMEESRKPPNPPVFFAKLVDRLNAKDRVKGLQEFEALNRDGFSMDLSIVNADGTIAYSSQGVDRLNWHKIAPPTREYEFVQINLGDPDEAHGPGPGGLGGPPPRPEGLIRFKGDPVQFLLVKNGGPHPGPPPIRFFLLSVVLMVLSILVGVGFALALLYKSLAKKVHLADSVISELQRGNLKARFPIQKRDEFKQAMIRFNRMADEIEHLVERVQQTEKSRMILLQELAHDLRTPIASLKNLLETFHDKGENLTPALKEELVSLSIQEVVYFERLVEDLLILAQVSEPRYHSEKKTVLMNQILMEESESIEAKYSGSLKKIKLKCEVPDRAIEVAGNELLLRRMLRNALDNAFSFAQKQVNVVLTEDLGKVTLLIEDDGKGFSSEALAAFGVRRVTRYLGSSEDERLSVGLGSVIMKTVAETHRGSIAVQNRVDPVGKISGASIRIMLPQS